MRTYVNVEFTQIIPYTHLLHAHSHIAILGWTFFAVFILFVILMGKQTSKLVKNITILLLVVTLFMFISFLAQGYALYSIIFSTLHIFLEYVVAYFIISNVRKNDNIPKSSRYFFYGSVVMLIISSIGPFGLGAIASLGLRDSPIFDMAIYFYLHFQYNGWLYLILIGMFLFILHQKNIQYSGKMMQYSFWIYFFALFPSYFLSVLWYGFGTIGLLLSIVGAVGQLTGVLLFVLAISKAHRFIKQSVSRIVYFHIIFILLLLVVKSVMELGLLHVPFGELIYETRSVVIGYLHLTLLGFISLFILMQFYLIRIINEYHLFVKLGSIIFLIGFLLNELVLFLSGLFSWLRLGTFPLHNTLLFVASVLLLVAILVIWTSMFSNKKGSTH